MIPRNSELNVNLYKHMNKDGSVDCQYHYELTLPNGSQILYMQNEKAANEGKIGAPENQSNLQLGEGAFIRTIGDTESYNIASGLDTSYANALDEVEDSYTEAYADKMDIEVKALMQSMNEGAKANPHAIHTVDNSEGHTDLSKAPVLDSKLNISKLEIGRHFESLIMDDSKKGEYVIASDAKGKLKSIPKPELSDDYTVVADLNLDKVDHLKPVGGETSNSQRLGSNYSSNDSKAYYHLIVGKLQGDKENIAVEPEGVDFHAKRAMNTLADSRKFVLDADYKLVLEVASPSAKLSDYVHCSSIQTLPNIEALEERLENYHKYPNDQEVVVVMTDGNTEPSQLSKASKWLNAINEKKAEKGIQNKASMVITTPDWDNVKSASENEERYKTGVKMYAEINPVSTKENELKAEQNNTRTFSSPKL